MSVWAVTGATGFIGRRLCKRLVDAGEKVVALTRPDGIGEVEGLPEVLGRPTDLDNREELRRALSGSEVVVHLAAPRRQIRRAHQPASRTGDLSVLSRTCETLVEAAARVGARKLILASSTAVYGHPWSSVDESSPVRPDTPYGRARIDGERIALATADRLGFDVGIGRLSEVYGTGSVGQDALVRNILSGDFKVFGSGQQVHQMIHVDDAARALEAFGRRSVPRGITLLISGTQSTLRDWIGGIADAGGVHVSYTPRLSLPLGLALRSLPKAAFAGHWRTLDYQIRPRLYRLQRSLQLLGPYQRTPLQVGVSSLVRAYREGTYR